MHAGAYRQECLRRRALPPTGWGAKCGRPVGVRSASVRAPLVRRLFARGVGWRRRHRPPATWPSCSGQRNVGEAASAYRERGARTRTARARWGRRTPFGSRITATPIAARPDARRPPRRRPQAVTFACIASFPAAPGRGADFTRTRRRRGRYRRRTHRMAPRARPPSRTRPRPSRFSRGSSPSASGLACILEARRARGCTTSCTRS